MIMAFVLLSVQEIEAKNTRDNHQDEQVVCATLRSRNRSQEYKGNGSYGEN